MWRVHSVTLCYARPRNCTQDTHHYTRSGASLSGAYYRQGSTIIVASLRPYGPLDELLIAEQRRGEERCVYKRQVTSSAEPSRAAAKHGDRNCLQGLQNVEQVLDSDSGNVRSTCHKFGRILACVAVRPTGYLTSSFNGTGEDFYVIMCKGMEDLLIYFFIYYLTTLFQRHTVHSVEELRRTKRRPCWCMWRHLSQEMGDFHGKSQSRWQVMRWMFESGNSLITV
jgi:hypothetical protein